MKIFMASMILLGLTVGLAAPIQTLGPGKTVIVEPATGPKTAVEYPVPPNCDTMTVTGSSYVFATVDTWKKPEAEINKPLKIVCKKQ